MEQPTSLHGSKVGLDFDSLPVAGAGELRSAAGSRVGGLLQALAPRGARRGAGTKEIP